MLKTWSYTLLPLHANGLSSAVSSGISPSPPAPPPLDLRPPPPVPRPYIT